MTLKNNKGMLGKMFLVSGIGASLMMQEPVKLKDCHKDPEEEERLKKIELEKLDKNLKILVREYNLIVEKKSKLPRRRRDVIVSQIQYLIKKGAVEFVEQPKTETNEQ